VTAVCRRADRCAAGLVRHRAVSFSLLHTEPAGGASRLDRASVGDVLAAVVNPAGGRPSPDSEAARQRWTMRKEDFAVNGRFLGTMASVLVGFACAIAAQSSPLLPYENWGACPFECCHYGTWTVKADTTILQERRDGAPKRFIASKGTRVEGVTGVVVTTRFGRAVAERERTIGLRRIALKPRDEVLLLHDMGEGVWKYWLQGGEDEEFLPDPENCARSADRSPTMYAQCAVQARELPTITWWVKVRNRDGAEGWTRQVERFGNVDACGGGAVPELARAGAALHACVAGEGVAALLPRPAPPTPSLRRLLFAFREVASGKPN
jgi:hypothetical protein